MGKKYDIEIAGDRNLSDFDRAIIEAHEKGESILSLHSEFDRFDPLVGDVPHFELANVTRRARDLLQNRTKQAIGYAVMIAEDATSRALIDFNHLPAGVTAQQLGETLGLSDEFRPRLLYRRRGLIEIRKLQDLPDAKWYEIFAALALAYVARAVNSGSSTSMEAMESLNYAEALASTSRANQASKVIGRKWKALLQDFVTARPDQSAPRIARAFLRDFGDDMRNDRLSAYSELTIKRWVRTLRKPPK